MKKFKLLALFFAFFNQNLFSMENYELAPLLNKDSGNSRSDYVIDIDDLKFNKFPVALETPDENKSAKKLNLLGVFPGPLLENMMKEFDGTEDLFLYYFLPLTGFLTEDQAQKIAENIYFNITKESKTAAGWQHILKKVRKTLLLSAKNKLDDAGQKRLREARKLIFNAFDKQEQEFKVLKTMRDFDALRLSNGDFDLIYDSQIKFISEGIVDFSEVSLKNLSNLELKESFIKAKLFKLLSLLALDKSGVASSRKSCNPIKSSRLCRTLSAITCCTMLFAIAVTLAYSRCCILNGDSFIGFAPPIIIWFIFGCCGAYLGVRVCAEFYLIFLNLLTGYQPSSFETIEKCFENEKNFRKEFLRRKRELLAYNYQVQE